MMIRLGLLFVVAAGFLAADSLRLRDGRTLTGNWLSADGQKIRFVVNDQVQTFAKSDVAQVVFGDAAPAAVPQDSQGPVRTPPRVPPASNQQQTQNGIKVQILKCQKQSTESVVCSLMVEAISSDQQFSLAASGSGWASFAVDSNGIQQIAQDCSLGSSQSGYGGSAGTLLVQGVPVRGQLRFKGVEPAVDRFAVLTVGGSFERFGQAKFQFRNVAIQ